jgi:WD40 repeat protein
MIQLSTRGLAEVRDLHFLPDGRLMAVAQKGIGIWNLGDSSREFVPLSYPWAVLPTLDGEQLIYSRYNEGLRLSSLTNPDDYRVLVQRTPVSMARFTPDGKHLVGWVSWNTANWLWWRTDTWEQIEPPAVCPARSYTERTWISHHRFAFSPDGEWALTFGDGPMRLLHFPTQKVETISLEIISDLQAYFSPDCVHLVVFSFTRLFIYNLQTKQFRTLSIKSSSKLYGATFTPDGAFFLVVGNDRSVHVIDTSSWTEARVYTWPIGKLRSVVISPDGLTAAVGGATSKIILWDLEL